MTGVDKMINNFCRLCGDLSVEAELGITYHTTGDYYWHDLCLKVTRPKIDSSASPLKLIHYYVERLVSLASLDDAMETYFASEPGSPASDDALRTVCLVATMVLQ